MPNEQIALELTLKAMDKGLINTQSPDNSNSDVINSFVACQITNFYFSVLGKLDAEKENAKKDDFTVQCF